MVIWESENLDGHVSLQTLQNLSELYLLMIFAILTVPGYITASFVKRCEELVTAVMTEFPGTRSLRIHFDASCLSLDMP